MTVYLGTDYSGGQEDVHPGHRPPGPRNGSHRQATGPHFRASKPVSPHYAKTARQEEAARRRVGSEVSVAPPPSLSLPEFTPIDAHPAGNPVEAADSRSGGSWNGAGTDRSGTGESSLADNGTFTDGANASGAGGSGAGAGFPGGGQADGDGYVAAQFTYIRGLVLKNLVYPPEARRMGLWGRVTASFVILEDGLARNIRIVKSSGHDVLDRTVLEAITHCQPFPRPPGRAELVIPIVFKLK